MTNLGINFKENKYWKPFWDVSSEYPKHTGSKLKGDIGILERKHVFMSGIIHIGKESNGLEKSEALRADSEIYEVYEDLGNLDEKFGKSSESILELRPRDVKKVVLSKQTLWNVKQKIILDQINRISNNGKHKLLMIENNMIKN